MRFPRLGVLIACVVSLLLACLAFPGDALDSASVDAALRAIRPEGLRAHMRFLSDPLLEGRAPDSAGYEIAARYVTARLESLGLQAGVKGSWYQSVPFRKSVLDQAKSTLVLVKDGREQALVDGQDYVLTASIVNRELSLEAPIVFAGFGVTAPEEKYDDYAGADVHGKIVAMFSGAPPRFPSTIRAYYADDMVKAENAKSHGAAAILTLFLPEDLKRQPWDWNVPQYRAGEIRWLEQSGEPHNPYSYSGIAILNLHASEILFTGAPRTLEEAYAAARHSQPLPAKRRHRLPTARLLGNQPPPLRSRPPASFLLRHRACPPHQQATVPHSTSPQQGALHVSLTLARTEQHLQRAAVRG